MSSILEISTDADERAFTPGGTLAGRVSWLLQEVPESVELRLFYYTSGKGTQDVGIAQSLSFDHPSTSERRDFSFKLPLGPCSFHGKLVSLTWALELILNHDQTERLEIVLSPTGQALDLYAHADGNPARKREKQKGLRFGRL